ncbi:MAG TPA: putative glycoside hydrolase [Candidatus Paceibacterota bacterium]
MRKINRKKTATLVLAVALVVFIAFSVFGPDIFRVKYDARHNFASVASTSDLATTTTVLSDVSENDPAFSLAGHVVTPVPLKAIYMTSWVAGTPSMRDRVIKLIDTTEANAVVIDIKDYTGMVAFKTGDAELDASPCIENRVRDIGDLIKRLHEKNIYVIGRVAVFQDPCFAKHNPEVAVRKKSDGTVWKDDKGLAWVDMASEQAWQHTAKIARASYALGFDEINFDYVRFPSDGNMKDIAFISGDTPKPQVFKSFFEFLDRELRGGKGTYSVVQTAAGTSSSAAATSTKMSSGMTVTRAANMNARATDPAFDEYYKLISSADPESVQKRTALSESGRGVGRMVISADLFGMTTTNTDDLGIGQILDYALPFVDYVYPMVYPSHYPANWNGFKNPAAHPYEVIKISMQGAINRAKGLGLDQQKLRPWLQDFDMGATYTADMIRKQIQATYDIGLQGWLMWDASNKYTPGGLLAN